MSEAGRSACIFGCSGPRPTEAERRFFREADPFGFILFARNIQDPAQVFALTAELRESVGHDAPIFVDQEGGRVQRLRAPHWREWMPPLQAVEAAGDLAPRMLWLRYRLIAAELRAVGIDGNCAPVADVLTAATHPFLANRCLSGDAATVAKLGRVVAEAHLAGGVLPVIKHLPGHGRAAADTHHDLPTVSADRETLSASDFAAFRPLADLPLAMTAHVVFAAWDERPATCSPAMIEVIRSDIGFGGLLMSDDLSMQALSGSIGTRAGAAIAAGCDIALHCNGGLAEMEAVAATAGDMGPKTLERARRALALRRTPLPIDRAALEAEHDALSGGHVHG
ncbi:beta-hexosaminidase [Cereibacter sphaeroides]|uniref:glycoside hydrolase family 3 N-terminal domain-containing protein n=1 Tax=Cereibacter sphaeroides TaxID=1063 RepID=UPI001F4462B3|nr:glycoside hydrolase family 3 N-terminal domain-containing protein [Cereibacter sphaeroides]MCE6962022.1 beta-hexosaminidase [Cereibacter sphaeroides]MCE6975607.1 beta-hexosaminidase [Cereibacter sphaeroides]